MISEYGCVAIQTDSYWFYLGAMKYVLALVGLVGGILAMLAGRLLLTYVLFCAVTGAVIALTNYAVYQMFGGLEVENMAYWLSFAGASIIGLLLGWLSTKYQRGGAIILAGWVGFEIGVAFSNLLYF